MNARIAVGGRELNIDVSRPVMLALALDFAGPQPRHFGAPPASSKPFEAAGFKGSVERGASCNCELITLIPHCNGTPNDRLITRRALERGWPASAPFEAQALLIRTLPNTADKRARDYSSATPPYLSQEAVRLLVSRGIQHLIVDVPSIDRAHDEGRLTAHRIFFGLPPGSVQLGAAARPGATITELAYMPDELADGAYLLELQVPALGGDAVPSRPLLYRLVTPAS